jgi:hypothetical protein
MGTPIELKFMDTVELCGLCKGWGAYYSRFREGTFSEQCEHCKGVQLVYKGTGKPVPESVQHQWANMNGLEMRMADAGFNRVLVAVHPSAEQGRIEPPWGKPCWELPTWNAWMKETADETV